MNTDALVLSSIIWNYLAPFKAKTKKKKKKKHLEQNFYISGHRSF